MNDVNISVLIYNIVLTDKIKSFSKTQLWIFGVKYNRILSQCKKKKKEPNLTLSEINYS